MSVTSKGPSAAQPGARSLHFLLRKLCKQNDTVGTRTSECLIRLYHLDGTIFVAVVRM